MKKYVCRAGPAAVYCQSAQLTSVTGGARSSRFGLPHNPINRCIDGDGGTEGSPIVNPVVLQVVANVRSRTTVNCCVHRVGLAVLLSKRTTAPKKTRPKLVILGRADGAILRFRVAAEQTQRQDTYTPTDMFSHDLSPCSLAGPSVAS